MDTQIGVYSSNSTNLDRLVNWCNTTSSRSTRSTLESDVAADDTVGNGHLRMNPHLLDYINPLKAYCVPSTEWYGRRQPIPFPDFSILPV